jgi:hypothetical protein
MFASLWTGDERIVCDLGGSAVAGWNAGIECRAGIDS